MSVEEVCAVIEGEQIPSWSGLSFIIKSHRERLFFCSVAAVSLPVKDSYFPTSEKMFCASDKIGRLIFGFARVERVVLHAF